MFQNESTFGELLKKGVSLGLFRNAIVSVVREDGERDHFVSQGSDLNSASVFDIASVTKFLVALLYFILRKKGLDLDFSTKVAPILKMKGQHVDELTVEHLLCFRTLFERGYPAKDAIQNGFDSFRAELLLGGMKEVPGTVFSYGNPHTIVLGWLLEELTQTPLFELIERNLIKPLGMRMTSQSPFACTTDVVQSCPYLRPGIIHDPAARSVYSERKELLGSAGLFSNADDLLSVLETVLCAGEFRGSEIIPREIVQKLPHGNYAGFGYGVPIWDTFRRNLEVNCPEHADPEGLFKLGHTGCIVATLPSHGFAFTVLTDFLMLRHDTDDERKLRPVLNHFFAAVPRLLA